MNRHFGQEWVVQFRLRACLRTGVGKGVRMADKFVEQLDNGHEENLPY